MKETSVEWIVTISLVSLKMVDRSEVERSRRVGGTSEPDGRLGNPLPDGCEEKLVASTQMVISTAAPSASTLLRAASMKATSSRVSRGSIGNSPVWNMATTALSSSR